MFSGSYFLGEIREDQGNIERKIISFAEFEGLHAFRAMISLNRPLANSSMGHFD